MRRRTWAGAAALLVFTTSAQAGLILTGDLVQIAPPVSVAQDALESNTQVFVFEESTSTLLDPVSVNVLDPGVYDQFADLVDGSIPADTSVISYFVHADPTADQSGPLLLSGTITFPNPVLGIIVLSADLTASDAALGAPGTLYTTGIPADLIRGTNVRRAPIELSADRLTVSLNTAVRLGRDEIRILTVPEPAAMVCLALLGSLVAMRRR